MEKVRVFTCFAGIGSAEMALRNLGLPYEVVGISEVDKYALLAYKAIHHTNEDLDVDISKEEMLKIFKDKNIAYNFSTNKAEIPKNIDDIKELYKADKISKNYGDIRIIDPNLLPSFDLLTYSYPCKNISVAGGQAGLDKGSGTQSSLLWECEKIISNKKPPYLLMENVKNLVGKKHINSFKEWIDVLDTKGYNSYWQVLNGKDYGVPQNRERVMMVSILKDKDTSGYIFPSKIPLVLSLKDILDKDVPSSYFISPHKYRHIIDNLHAQEALYCTDTHYYEGISVDQYIKKRRRQLIQIGNLDNKTHANTRVYSDEGLCPTLNSMNGGNRQPKIATEIRNAILIRKLTELECWRVMGFTDEDFYKARDIAKLPKTKLYERAGRAIVVPMLEAIFVKLFR